MASWHADPLRETNALSRFGAPWGEALGRLPLWRVVVVGSVACLLGAALDEPWKQVGVALGLSVIPLTYWAANAYRRCDSIADMMGEVPSWKQLRLAVLTASCVFVVRTGWQVAYWLITGAQAFASAAPQQPAAEQAPAGLLVSASLLLYTSILGPLAEEIFFRGLLFRRLLRFCSLPLAALCASASFGLLHFDPVGHGLTGLVMVVLSLRTRSLWAPLIAHALNNTLFLAVLALLVERSFWWVAVPQLVCAPWLAWFLWRGLRQGSTTDAT